MNYCILFLNNISRSLNSVRHLNVCINENKCDTVCFLLPWFLKDACTILNEVHVYDF